MSIIKEVADGIKLVGESIKNIREIQKAIKDGKGYFEKKHPDIKTDVKVMLGEMQKTCDAISKAAGIITHFSFNTSPGAIDSEPTRFNNLFIDYKKDLNAAEEMIKSLKGHCTIIRHHAEAIAQNKSQTFWNIIGLHSPEKEDELAQKLHTIYDDEMSFHSTVYQMAKSINIAINDVSDAIETNGMMMSANVPLAAQKLLEYKVVFRELEDESKNTAAEIADLSSGL